MEMQRCLIWAFMGQMSMEFSISYLFEPTDVVTFCTLWWPKLHTVHTTDHKFFLFSLWDCCGFTANKISVENGPQSRGLQAFNFNDPSSNRAEGYNFFLLNFPEKCKNGQKEAENGQCLKIGLYNGHRPFYLARFKAKISPFIESFWQKYFFPFSSKFVARTVPSLFMFAKK